MSIAGFSPVEFRAVASLASLYLIRMLGLFMLLPVLALYARDLPGSTPVLVGFALGIYGLSQAFLQLPLAMLSDRVGRKPVIVGGLLMFLLGSLVAAASQDIYGIIIGRALQGAGAIASTLMALLADVTREQNRSKAMASIGASIGISFALSLVVGPYVAAHAGLSGLFLATAGLSLLGIGLTRWVVPAPVQVAKGRNVTPSMEILKRCLRTPQLLRLDAGAFVLHFIMTAIFIAVPLVLADELHIDRASHGKFYGLLLGASFLAMVPLMVIAERKRKVKSFFLLAVGSIVLSLPLVALFETRAYGAFATLWLFFLAFNFLESMLPSILSRSTLRSNRGTATGIYSSCQFLGAFAGGSAGGWTLQHFHTTGVFVLCALLALCWLGWSFGMDGPQHLRSISLALDASVPSVVELSSELEKLPGVRDVLIIAGENMAYLQVDGHFDSERLDGLPVSMA